MGRPRSPNAKPIRQLVHDQRGKLYAAGYQNLNMLLPTDVITRIDAWKQRYRLGSRDAVVAQVIRECMASTELEELVLHPSSPATEMRRISPIVSEELVSYVKAIQDRFRGIAYGPVFEMIAAAVGTDLSVDGKPTAYRNRNGPEPMVQTV